MSSTYRLFATSVAAFGSLVLSASVAAADPSLPELAARAGKSVVLLTIKDTAGHKHATGTGFFVSADGRIVTNHHVVAEAESIDGTLVDGRVVRIAGLLATDKERDIAVLQAEGGGFEPLPLGSIKSARVGDEIVVIGNPKGLSNSLSTGIIAAIRDHGIADVADSHEFASWGVQITAPIAPGSSGSPVMTRAGEVVAIAVGGATGANGLGFAVPSDVAKAMVDGIAPGAAPRPVREAENRPVLTNLGISAAFFAGIAVLFGAGLWIGKRVARRRGPTPARSLGPGARRRA
jgi:S1-C subfamily serine protease